MKHITAFLALFLISFQTQSGVFDAVEAEIDCLAKNIYYEARGESFKGKVAVANVTLNRTKSDEFPDSICAVVAQKAKKVCQFSWVCNKDLKAPKKELYANIRELAEKIYYGEVKDVTKGATHFHSTAVMPSWATKKRMTAKIGNHYFYRKT